MNWIRGKSYIWHDIYIYYIFTYFNMLECSPNRVCKQSSLLISAKPLIAASTFFLGVWVARDLRIGEKKPCFLEKRLKQSPFKPFLGFILSIKLLSHLFPTFCRCRFCKAGGQHQVVQYLLRAKGPLVELPMTADDQLYGDAKTNLDGHILKPWLQFQPTDFCKCLFDLDPMSLSTFWLSTSRWLLGSALIHSF